MNEDIALKSLKFLNSRFSLNLQKDNELVLMKFNEKEYITHEFADKNKLEAITRLKLVYILTPLGEDSYEFVLKSPTADVGSYDYKGSFKVINSENGYQFLNLTFIMRSD